MLGHAYVQTVTKVSFTRNAYGDTIPSGSSNTTLNCRVRMISEVVDSPNREQYQSPKLMLWFAPSSGILINDILLYESRYWKINEVREARKLGSSTIEFLKCFAEQTSIVS